MSVHILLGRARFVHDRTGTRMSQNPGGCPCSWCHQHRLSDTKWHLKKKKILSLAGNLGLLIWVIKAEQPQRAALPILSVCAIFSCFGQTMVCLPACGIFNKRTDVDACNCTRGLHGRRKRLCMGSWLWEKNTLLHRGLEPASVLCLAFQSDALQTEHGVPPGVLGCSKKKNVF